MSRNEMLFVIESVTCLWPRTLYETSIIGHKSVGSLVMCKPGISCFVDVGRPKLCRRTHQSEGGQGPYWCLWDRTQGGYSVTVASLASSCLCISFNPTGVKCKQVQ